MRIVQGEREMHSRTLLMAGVALGFAIAGGTDAGALPMPNGTPTIKVDINDEIEPGGSVSLGGTQVGDTQPINVDPASGDFGVFQSFDTAEGNGNISGGGNVDPGQTFAVAFTDLGAPTAIAAALIAPITPILGTVSVFGDWSISVSDFLPSGPGSGDGGAITGGGPGGAFVAFDINGVFVLIPPQPALIAYPAGASSLVFGPFPGGPILIDCTATFGVGGCTSMSTLIAFTGAGGGDAYAVSSTLTITEVPEPVALSVLGLGLLGLGGALRRRSRSA